MTSELGRGTNRAELSGISGGELRNAFDKLMHGRSAPEMGMGKTPMPKERQLITGKAVNGILQGRGYWGKEPVTHDQVGKEEDQTKERRSQKDRPVAQDRVAQEKERRWDRTN